MASPRSPRLRPQIQASQDGASVTHRRSLRLHPQIQSNEEGAGVTRRRSPRLHPDVSDDGTGVIRRSHGTSPAAVTSLPDNNDMLREILLRLPPQPSSLPRASAVCRRWRGLVTDPKFHRQFYAHHRKPPILGFFQGSHEGIGFTPVLDPPDRIPPQRFSLGCCSDSWAYDLVHCCHGLVLVKDRVQNEVVVCDPITGEQRRVAVLPEFKKGYFTGAVLCAAGNGHGGCHLSPFKVVLVSMLIEDNVLACVYSSETSEWGDLVSIEAPCDIEQFDPHATLVGNVIYWLFNTDRILEFYLERQNLAVTVMPPDTNDFVYGRHHIIQAEDGAVGFAILVPPRLQTWQRNVSRQGVAIWVPWKTIEMHNILGPSLQIGEQMTWLGYDEDNDVIFLYANHSVYSVQLKSMKSKKLCETRYVNHYYPFKSFYTPAIREGDEAGMLHDP